MFAAVNDLVIAVKRWTTGEGCCATMSIERDSGFVVGKMIVVIAEPNSMYADVAVKATGRRQKCLVDGRPPS